MIGRNTKDGRKLGLRPETSIYRGCGSIYCRWSAIDRETPQSTVV